LNSFLLWRNRLDRRLLRNFGYIGISNLVYAASQWGVLILATKLSNVENVGRLALGLAVATPIMTFLGASLKVFITVDIEHKYTFPDYFFVRALTSLTGIMVIILFGFVSRYSLDTFFVLVWIGVVKVIEGFQEVCWGINQRADFMDPVGISRLLRSIACIVSVWLGLWLTHNLIASILIWAASWLFILVIYDLPKAKNLEVLAGRIKMDSIQNILVAVMPLAVIAGLGSLNDKATQYQIAAILGETAVGYYSPLAYVVQGIGLVVVSITETATPRLAKYYSLNRKAYIQGTLLLAAVGTLIGTAAMIVLGSMSYILLPILYTRKFLDFQYLFWLLLGIGIIRYAQTGFGVAVTAAIWLRQQVPILVISLAVTLVGGWLWIPQFGLNGAAYSVAFGTAYLLVAYIFLWARSTRGSLD
jgi:O-antigen/teichoic acid export membrane protein